MAKIRTTKTPGDDEAGRKARLARSLLEHPLAGTVEDMMGEFYATPGNCDPDNAAIGTLLLDQAFDALRERAATAK